MIHIKFATAACQACSVGERCTHAASEPRSLLIRDQEHFADVQAARRRQTMETFKHVYAARAGVERTTSQGVWVGNLRRACYSGLAKTRLQHLFAAMGMNLLRLAEWFDGTPRGRTRISPFVALAAAA